MRVAYRYFHGKEPPRELASSGSLVIEFSEDKLRGRIHGDLFKPSPFEFCFHNFWLTRRGLIHAVFDLAENRPPAHRSASETFIHFELGADLTLRREAEVFSRRFVEKRSRRIER